MTSEEIKSICRQGNHVLEFELYSKVFETELTHMIFQPTLNWTTGEYEKDINILITDYITECINTFLQLEKISFIEKLKEDIFNLFNIFIESAQCGEVPDGLVERYGNTEANRIYFNGQNKDTVFANCKFSNVFYDNSTKPDIWFQIGIKLDWDIEHDLCVFFKNGEYVNIE